ncbi:hypothetical protein DAI22_12g048550 [Oryza sativa Japonica Group]|nr:hypothetical protein DAI22_12g048550 [Oryza sativa Japonica Group]
MRRAGEPEKRRGGGGGALTVARAEHGCFLGNEGRGCGCCGGDFLVLLLLLLLLLPLPSSASAESPAGRVAQCRRLGSEEDRAACGGRSAATSRGGERGIRRRWRRRLGGDGKETGERRRREAEAERGKKRRLYSPYDRNCKEYVQWVCSAVLSAAALRLQPCVVRLQLAAVWLQKRAADQAQWLTPQRTLVHGVHQLPRAMPLEEEARVAPPILHSLFLRSPSPLPPPSIFFPSCPFYLGRRRTGWWRSRRGEVVEGRGNGRIHHGEVVEEPSTVPAKMDP